MLLTGFGPFPGVPVNASADLARKVVRLARGAFPAFRFAAAVLPTEWRRAPVRVASLHERHRPVLALHFGVASTARGIRLETRAENVCRASLDAAGLLPLAPTLCDDGPTHRLVGLNLSEILRALTSLECPCSISDDAGGYLCNAVLYQSLASAEAHGGAAGFVHIPADLSAPSLETENVVLAALAMVRAALNVGRETALRSSKRQPRKSI